VKIITIVSVFLLLNGSLISPSLATPWQVPIAVEGATSITADEAMDLINQMQELVLIDSRQTNQFKGGTIKGSISLPNPQTSPRALANIIPDKFTPVLFYCDGLSCSQSMKSIKKAVSYGYANIFWLRGGVNEWIEKGFPIVTQ